MYVLCMQLIIPGFSQEVTKCIPMPTGNRLNEDDYCVGSYVSGTKFCYELLPEILTFKLLPCDLWSRLVTNNDVMCAAHRSRC